MTRTTYAVKPFEKKMEVYQNFSGGLNSMTAPDNMLDTELKDVMNEDIADRGSLKRRHGLKKTASMYRVATWADIGGKKWSEL